MPRHGRCGSNMRQVNVFDATDRTCSRKVARGSVRPDYDAPISASSAISLAVSAGFRK